MVDFLLKGETNSMKIGLIAASLFFLAMPVHAQALVGSGGGGLGPVSFSFSIPVIDRTATHYNYIYAQGSDATFVPTRFVSYDKAVKIGKEALAYRPKTIVEVAAECRAAKKRIR